MLAVIETHPIQYHAPVYRVLTARFGVPVTAIYGSDFSVAGYHDPEFNASFAWDVDLLSGYSSVFLSRVASGGARETSEVRTNGLRAALARVRPSAILIGGYSPAFHRAAWYEAWRSGVPALFRGEANDDANRRGVLKAGLRSAALRAAYAHCSAVLYIGRRAYAHYRRLGVPDERLVFSPYCVDLTPFEPEEAARLRWRTETRQRLGLAEDRIVLLCSGKLSARKGVGDLLPAVRRLPPAVRARIAVVALGAGELQHDLERAARADPPIAFMCVGFKNQRELSPYYHAADLLVLPSRHAETWGLVVNEALHHGIPCVVSDRVGCAPDLIEQGRTGGIAAAASAESLARTLLEAMALVGRPDIREACRAKVAAYSVDRAAAGIAEAYTRVTKAVARPA